MAEQKLLKIRWNAHQGTLVSYFGNLLSKESFVDVTLVSSEGKKIMCHKIILSSCSPYFQNVFESNPCKHPIVILKDVQYEELKTIITFIYHGEVNISQDNINSILSTATSLQIKGLADVPTGDSKKGAGRKRDGESNRSPTLLTSTSSNSGEIEDSGSTTLQGTDIPRKKLKKSATVSGSISTNGEPSVAGGSLESGFGASINRSVDDGSNSAAGSDRSDGTPPVRISKKKPDLRGALSMTSVDEPSSHPISHLPGKSQSLDQLRDREAVLVDSELSSGGFSENQTFDEATMGDERTGYEIDLADVKIEAETDGEIEFEDDDEDDEESYNHPEFNELNSDNPYPNIPSSSSYYQPAHHFASSRMRRRVKYPKFSGDGAAVVVNSKYEQAIADLVQNPALTFREGVQGLKGRKLRPLLRQPRIKRPEDNDMGGELFIAEPEQTSSDNVHEELQVDIDDHSSPHSVPIVTVSQCSPTPPSSPVNMGNSPVPSPPPCSIIISNVANSTTLSSTSSSTSSIVATNNSLLMVPNAETTTGGSIIVSGSERRHSGAFISGGAQFVKQISQPLLPSHTSVLSISSSGTHPVIRRQHSQPNPSPSGHHQHSHGTTRIIPLTSTNPLNRNTFYHIVAADQSRDDQDSSTGSGNAIILDSNSLIQFVPTGLGDGTSRITISPANVSHTITKEDRTKEQGDSLDVKDESESGHVQHLTVHRAAHSHCPALRPGPALGCNFCWNSVDECGRILRRKTKYHCPECHINLCIVPCFQDYHEKAEKKKARLKSSKPSSM